MRSRTGATGLVLIAALAFTGCAAPNAPGDAITPEPSAPESAPTILPVATGTVAATGSFTSRLGIRGEVSIVKVDGDYRIDLHDFSRPEGNGFELSLIGEAVDGEAECAAHGVAYVPSPVVSRDPGPALSTEPEQSFLLRLDFAPALADPSYAHSVFINHVDLDDPGGGCPWGTVPVGAAAELSWTIGDLRPDLEVVDAGRAEHATGEVTLADDGGPLRYLIAPGDLYADIAARFGLRPEDLDYLNPVSDWSSGRDYLEAGCTLNLAKESRGARGECTTAP